MKTLLAAILVCLSAPAASANGFSTAAAASQDFAAIPADLDCVRSRLSPDEWRDVMRLALAQGAREDPRARPLLQAIETCGNRLSWSLQKRRLAGMFAFAVAGAAAVREDLSGRGVQIEQLDRTILADRELVAAAENSQLDSAIGEAFARRHFDEITRIAGGQSLEGEIGARIGNYIAFRVLIATLAAQFGREP